MINFQPPSQAEYNKSKAWGILTSVDIHECDPKTIRDAESIKLFTKTLCEKIKVKMYGDTQLVMFGDDPRVHGYSMVQLIETSLVSAHFAEESNSVYLDVFSCKYYDASEIVNYSMDFFKGKKCNASCILRGAASDLPGEFEEILDKRNIFIQPDLK